MCRVKDCAAQKLLSRTWQREEMEYTCVVHNSFLIEFLQDFLEGGKVSLFCHLTVVLASLPISAIKSPPRKNYSVSTTASSLNCHS